MQIGAVWLVTQQVASDHDGGEGSHHENFGVRKVDHAKHAIDHRVTERNKDVNKSLDRAREGQLPELTYEGMQVALLVEVNFW